MLILSRRPGEAILIGEGVRLVILECDRSGVRVGIEAPPSVTILREEIASQVADANRHASRVPDASPIVKRLAPAAGKPRPGDKEGRGNG